MNIKDKEKQIIVQENSNELNDYPFGDKNTNNSSNNYNNGHIYDNDTFNNNNNNNFCYNSNEYKPQIEDVQIFNPYVKTPDCSQNRTDILDEINNSENSNTKKFVTPYNNKQDISEFFSNIPTNNSDKNNSNNFEYPKFE